MATLTGLRPFAAFSEDAPAQLLDADVTLLASESLVGGRLVVSGLMAGDIVSVLDAASPAGVNLQGASVRLGAQQIGTLAGGSGTNLVVTFTAGVTTAGVEALIERLAFRHVEEPAVESHTLRIGLEDAAGTSLLSSVTAGFTLVPQASSPLLAIAGAISPSLVDLNGDGLLDLFVTSTLAAPAFTPLTGTANPFNGISVTNSTNQIIFQDLDADGRQDLLLGSATGVLAWRNAGSGFTSLAAGQNPLSGLAPPAGNFVGGVNTFGDLNGDGQLDVVGLTGTIGMVLAAIVHPASVQGSRHCLGREVRDGAGPLLRQARRLFRSVKHIIGDAGYQGPKMAAAVARTGTRKIEIVRRCDKHKFVAQPKRSIVERTIGWISPNRRLVREFERHGRIAAALVRMAMIRIMLRRLAPKDLSVNPTFPDWLSACPRTPAPRPNGLMPTSVIR